MANKPRAGAVRKTKKGPTKGSGGQGRKALEGKGPTPKAEEREYHPAAKRKALAERSAAKAAGRGGQRSNTAGGSASRRATPDDAEIVTGRNSVLEALRARIPATTLYIAARIEVDDRVKEILNLATRRGVPVLEVMRPELDRLSGRDAVHQGVALKVPPYEYAHVDDVLDEVLGKGQTPLFIALDGVTDPRNLGAIIRSTAAFGGQTVIVPQRRSVGMTAAAWKTSAGAAARTPVSMASNLTQTLQGLQKRGLFVLGLDGGGDVSLHSLELADRGVVIVVGSEGKGLSRLVSETCDAIVSIPISAATESLNAGIAASVTLYEIAKRRAEGGR
ncbi:23S rRNA (guanosine(2251)-2'-O)-methyltransferase RlmB [Humibacter ginsenosidimutans]|uniref:23S rRNA (Guanosine(2251)-2'-O)-methyltransferase RlmB n=1 Tax=Humibacter ginsenosidimutans TaxID=2599293 RepID=A0A5B8M296_9MICO|nr:23S rRNA (guanosine(2251)-2'-O)-methyltransferase RlmB [Humibacter ginsenosidimutans]QDZ14777.1 23S rRNA (guanosine(2251)-2'-O)-methyltransferase RlmB [Humibacter ginsenosidimutans]